jgi:acyl-CoA reductase-like NAD-dependent aldehyde dehydrogenase
MSAVQKLPIGADWLETGETIEVRSPYDGAVVGTVAWARPGEALAALDAAERAMATPLPAHRRAEILDTAAQLLRERREEFARTLSLEAGKPINAARIETDRAVQTFLFSAAEARGLSGEMVAMDAHPVGEGKIGLVLRVPIGIIGAITPFNFPLNLVVHKVAPAFAAGCACVLKPARKTPLSALRLAETLSDAGLPSGWLSVVVGPSDQIGDVLIEDERVKMITFTGSSVIGWQLKARAPNKKISLELGNSTPVIVLADADVDAAAAAVTAYGFAYAGQSCISVQRVYAEDRIHDPFLERLVSRAQALTVGDPLDPATDVGPLIDDQNRDRVLRWIEDAASQGATIEVGGRINDEGLLEPTVLSDVSLEMTVASREVFGPVVALTRVSGLNEAIEQANATAYGLQAGIFTSSIRDAIKAAYALEFGGVTVNEAPGFRSDQMPYGGVKDSGNTREGPRYAVEEMTERRVVVIRQ